MVLTELLDLLELLRAMVSRKAILDKDYFENFVQPLWVAFTKVHEYYKKSFKGYIDFISKDGSNVDELIEQLQQDLIYTTDLRSEIGRLIKHFPVTQFKANAKDLQWFLTSIVYYFDVRGQITINYNKKEKVFEFNSDGPYCLEYVIQHLANAYDEIVKEAFRDLSPPEERDRTKIILNRAMVAFQISYGIVADAYYHLRKEFLA